MFTRNRNTPNYWITDNSTGPRSAPFSFSNRLGRPKRKKFPVVPEEALTEPNELADEYYRYYRPSNNSERDMVDSMVENEMRLRDAELTLELDAQEAEALASRYW